MATGNLPVRCRLMDGESRALTGAWAVLGLMLAGVLDEQRGTADGEPQRFAEMARADGRDDRATIVGWRMSRYRPDELAAWLTLIVPHPREALAEIDRHGRRWWDSLPDDVRPSLADWKTGAYDLVVLTASDEVVDSALAWLDLTWAEDRRLWFDDPEHPAMGKPLLTLTDNRVPIVASAAAAAWLGTVLPDVERIATDLQQRTNQFTAFLADP